MEEISVKKQLKISIPIAFENLINILMTLVDTLAISTIGILELGAIGAMSVVINLMQMSIQTINVSNNTLVAKSVGENNIKTQKMFIGNAIIMTLLISLITIVIIYLIQPIFPSLFDVDKICVIYIKIRLIGFLQNSVVTVLSGYQRTIGKQGVILKLRIFAVILNLFMDIIAVNLGYGIIGVAWVTVFIDTILMIYLVIISKNDVEYSFKTDLFKQIWNLFKWNFVERIASKIDNFIFNILVSRMGSLEYAVHIILIQLSNIYEAFIQGFGDGITITVGIASGNKSKKSIDNIKIVAKKITNICSALFPLIVFVISIVIMKISLKTEELQIIFFKVLPLLLVSTYITMSATYYFSILRGFRDFKFLAKRNIISSFVKILLAIILSYTSLGIVGVWLAYVVYGILQKYLSKIRYIKLHNML